jgi:hypothetical protein
MNHENTKFRKHEMFGIIFVFSFFVSFVPLWLNYFKAIEN